jgi:hypothetical protein
LIGGHFAFSLAPQIRCQRFHEDAFVEWIQRVLTIVPIKPPLDKNLIESSRIDRLASLTELFKLIELLRDHRQQVRAGGKLGHVVDGIDELHRMFSTICIAVHDTRQVASNLTLIKRE